MSSSNIAVANKTLRWRHNERNGVANHQPHDDLLNHLFRRRSQKTSKLSVTGFCEGNLLVTGAATIASKYFLLAVAPFTNMV